MTLEVKRESERYPNVHTVEGKGKQFTIIHVRVTRLFLEAKMPGVLIVV